FFRSAHDSEHSSARCSASKWIQLLVQGVNKAQHNVPSEVVRAFTFKIIQRCRLGISDVAVKHIHNAQSKLATLYLQKISRKAQVKQRYRLFVVVSRIAISEVL